MLQHGNRWAPRGLKVLGVPWREKTQFQQSSKPLQGILQPHEEFLTGQEDSQQPDTEA